MNRCRILIGLLLLEVVVAPPVTQQKKDGEKSSENEVGEGENAQLGSLGIEYSRYLKEVVTALESDPEFREKLEKAEEVDIRTGKIAQELEYVNHNVRTKLDELKRQELERLRHLTAKDSNHLDHVNPHTFEVEDLRKLIAKTTADLAEADKMRRQEFKEYEMQKKFEREQKLQNVPEEKRHELEEEMKKMEEKHKKHEPLHHPGSKQQLEEVWEKQDHMENQEFDPKTFFYLHDLDGNGVWDEEEVKTLFLKELDKLYQAGAPEDDMRERREEMERMREHVFNEADTNRDGFISYQEFLQQTQKADFEKDDGWQGLDEQQVYSPEEYAAFEQRRQQEVQRMIQQGLIPPHPNGLPSPHPGSHQFQQAQHFPPGVQQVHPNQIPQGQYHPGQVPQGQFHPGQVPQGQFHPGQVPPAQYYTGHIPQGQVHPAQAQQQQAQYQGGQMPQEQAFHAGAAPHAQYYPAQGQAHYQTGNVPQVQVQHGQAPPAQFQQPPGQNRAGLVPPDGGRVVGQNVPPSSQQDVAQKPLQQGVQKLGEVPVQQAGQQQQQQQLVQPGQQPVQPGQQPVQPGQQPVQPGQQPVQPGQQPVQPGQQPVQPGQQPVQPGQQPVQPGQQPVQPGQQPVQPGQQPVQPGQQPVQPGQQPVQPGQQPVQSGQQPVQPGQQPVQPGQQPVQPGQQPVQVPIQQTGQQPIQPGQVPVQ